MVLGCSFSGSQPTPQLITPDTALKVAASWFDSYRAAVDAHDAIALSRLDTGVASTIDQAAAAQGAVSKSWLLGLGPAAAIHVYVPRQSTYPARFAAVFDSAVSFGGGSRLPFLASLQEADSGGSWRCEFLGPLDLPAGVTVQLDKQGYLSTGVAGDGLTRKAEDAMKRDLQAAGATTPSFSGAFRDSDYRKPPFSTETGRFKSFTQASFTLATRAATEGPALGLPISTGHLALLELSGVETVTPSSGCAVQDPTRGGFGALLAPGRYSAVHYQAYLMSSAVGSGSGHYELLQTVELLVSALGEHTAACA